MVTNLAIRAKMIFFNHHLQLQPSTSCKNYANQYWNKKSSAACKKISSSTLRVGFNLMHSNSMQFTILFGRLTDWKCQSSKSIKQRRYFLRKCHWKRVSRLKKWSDDWVHLAKYLGCYFIEIFDKDQFFINVFKNQFFPQRRMFEFRHVLKKKLKQRM